MAIVQISSCTDWYYLEWDKDGQQWSAVPVAAWAVMDNGEVQGLIPVKADPNASVNYPKLVPVPERGNGQFRHFTKLTLTQKEAARAQDY